MASVAKVLSGQDPMLPPRDAPYLLQGVYERVVDGCRAELILDCGDAYLQISVDENTDVLGVDYHNTRYKRGRECRSVAANPPWNRCIGKECGWTWRAVNHQGYFDTLLMSFAGIVPSVMLHSLASSIDVFSIVPNEGAGQARKRRNA